MRREEREEREGERESERARDKFVRGGGSLSLDQRPRRPCGCSASTVLSLSRMHGCTRGKQRIHETVRPRQRRCTVSSGRFNGGNHIHSLLPGWYFERSPLSLTKRCRSFASLEATPTGYIWCVQTLHVVRAWYIFLGFYRGVRAGWRSGWGRWRRRHTGQLAAAGLILYVDCQCVRLVVWGASHVYLPLVSTEFNTPKSRIATGEE